MLEGAFANRPSGRSKRSSSFFIGLRFNTFKIKKAPTKKSGLKHYFKKVNGRLKHFHFHTATAATATVHLTASTLHLAEVVGKAYLNYAVHPAELAL